MKRLRVFLCALFALSFACAGCASEGGKAQWDDFWKDVRGDNMQMRDDVSQFK
jgi:hypothetical protein